MHTETAAGTNRRFQHRTTTTASRADVWRLWTDVTTWKRWDQGLADANLDGPFAKAAEGTIIPTTGRAATFRVTEMDPGRSYAFETKLPAARLRIQRDFIEGEDTTFRHSVSFEGLLAPLWATLLGRGFRRQLPTSMQLLADEAEAR